MWATQCGDKHDRLKVVYFETRQFATLVASSPDDFLASKVRARTRVRNKGRTTEEAPSLISRPSLVRFNTVNVWLVLI